MTMGDRIKPGAKWTLGNVTHPDDKATANKNAPTGGQTAPGRSQQENGEPEPTSRVTTAAAAMS